MLVEERWENMLFWFFSLKQIWNSSLKGKQNTKSHHHCIHNCTIQRIKGRLHIPTYNEANYRNWPVHRIFNALLGAWVSGLRLSKWIPLLWAGRHFVKFLKTAGAPQTFLISLALYLGKLFSACSALWISVFSSHEVKPVPQNLLSHLSVKLLSGATVLHK